LLREGSESPLPVKLKIGGNSMRNFNELTDEEIQRMMLEGDQFLIIELRIVGKEEKFNGKAAYTLDFQAAVRQKRISPWMQDKIRCLSDICNKTVMKVDDRTRDKIFTLLKENRGKEVCLYRLEVWMSVGDGGSIVWDVQDFIDPAFVKMDGGAVIRRADDAREQVRVMMGEVVE